MNCIRLSSVCVPDHPLHKQHLHDICVSRAGILPYTVINGCAYLLLGVKHPYKDQPGHPGRRTDFGGHAIEGETLHTCSIREFREESGGVVKEPEEDRLTVVTFPYKDKIHGMLLYKYENYIVDKATALFKANEEISYISWYPLETVYFESDMNDMGLNLFLRSTPLPMLYSILVA